MDHFYDGRSATDMGTLFQLRNALCQRSVTKSVSESYNYVSEFLSFVTKAYTLGFALDALGLEVFFLYFLSNNLFILSISYAFKYVQKCTHVLIKIKLNH